MPTKSPARAPSGTVRSAYPFQPQLVANRDISIAIVHKTIWGVLIILGVIRNLLFKIENLRSVAYP